MSTPPERNAIEATVLEELPEHLFRVRTDAGHDLQAGPSQEAKRLGMDIRKGARVWVRPASLDPGRGVIVRPV